MKLIIQSPDFRATMRLQKFVKQHVNKLEDHYDRIEEGEVCLRIDNGSKVDNKRCDLKIAIPGSDLFASKQAATFEESVVKAVDAVKHQIERVKTKHEKLRVG